jgi:hypothetical protein
MDWAVFTLSVRTMRYLPSFPISPAAKVQVQSMRRTFSLPILSSLLSAWSCVTLWIQLRVKSACHSCIWVMQSTNCQHKKSIPKEGNNFVLYRCKKRLSHETLMLLWDLNIDSLIVLFLLLLLQQEVHGLDYQPFFVLAYLTSWPSN